MAFNKSMVKIDGIAVESAFPEEMKHKEPLLFVHGSSGGSWIWEHFLAYFSSKGWKCYALNLRGHHLSDSVEDWGDVGADSYLEDLDKVAKWIGEDIVLLGHSMGGVIVQKYAETHNPVKLILLHTGPPRKTIVRKDFNAFMKQVEEKGRISGGKVLKLNKDPGKLLGYMFDSGNIDDAELKAAHEKLGPESARAVLEMKDITVDAEKIKCPVYVLGFDLKKIGVVSPVDIDKQLVDYYKAKDYQVIEPGGHMFMLEKNWEDFARLIEKWLFD